MAPLHFAFLCAIISRPPSPCFRLKTLSISRQPTFLMACCYRRTFPPVFLKWQSSTPFERYFQKGLMMAAAWTVMAAARWMANIDAAGFVLIKSSCISWSRTSASRSATAYSEHGADAHISFMPKEKCAGCLPKLFIISTPDHPPRTVFLYPLGLLRRLSDGKNCYQLLTTFPCAKVERLDEYASTAGYFGSKLMNELPAEIPCPFINLPLLFLAQRKVYNW